MGDWCPLCGQNTRFGILCANPACSERLTPATVEVAGLASRSNQPVAWKRAVPHPDDSSPRLEERKSSPQLEAYDEPLLSDNVVEEAFRVTTVIVQGSGLKELGNDAIDQACRDLAAADDTIGFWDDVKCVSDTVAHAMFPNADTARTFVELADGELQITLAIGDVRYFTVTLAEEDHEKSESSWGGMDGAKGSFGKDGEKGFSGKCGENGFFGKGGLKDGKNGGFDKGGSKGCVWCMMMGQCWMHQKVAEWSSCLAEDDWPSHPAEEEYPGRPEATTTPPRSQQPAQWIRRPTGEIGTPPVVKFVPAREVANPPVREEVGTPPPSADEDDALANPIAADIPCIDPGTPVPVTTVCVQGADLLSLDEDGSGADLHALDQACKAIALKGGFSVHDDVKCWSESLAHVEFPDADAAAMFVQTTNGRLTVLNKSFTVKLKEPEEDHRDEYVIPSQRAPEPVAKGEKGCRWCRLNECWTHQGLSPSGPAVVKPARYDGPMFLSEQSHYPRSSLARAPRNVAEQNRDQKLLSGVNADMWGSYLQMFHAADKQVGKPVKRQRLDNFDVDQQFDDN